MKVIVREARPEDAARLLAYVHDLLREPGLDIPLAPDEFTLTVEEEAAILAEYAAADNSVLLLAEAGSEIVGELNCKGGKRRALRHAALLGMSVRHGWRGKGVGSALMARAIEWAERSGVVTRIELYVYARNEPAIRLYRKFGFEVEGRRRRVIYQNGEYVDDLIMARLL